MDKTFAAELARFGPESQHPPLSLSQARVYCARLTHTHYENFSVVSWMLPRHLHRPFQSIYAYCRWADDLADETGGGPRTLELLRWWKKQLIRCYEGETRHPVFTALLPTIRRFRIPPRPFLDLIFAFEQDQLVKRYPTYEQLVDYCRCSANPVGRLVLYLLGLHTPERVELSDRICTGLQLANFWQDVARDYDIGRVYLPEEDMKRFGYTKDDLMARRFNSPFSELMRFEVDRTRDLFYRGFPLVERVPPQYRVDIDLFIRGGLGILEKIEQLGYNVWMRRPTLSKLDKGALLMGAVWRRLRAALF